MNYGRTIRFYTETGELIVDSINKGKRNYNIDFIESIF